MIPAKILGKSPSRTLGLMAIAAALGVADEARGQGPAMSLDALTRMTPAQLDALYGNAIAGPVPTGRVKGRALLRPGTRLGPAISRGAGVAWQGKVFEGDGTSINRFFGLKMIRARVAPGPSWRDGAPATILDYSQTSRVYARYRDELRMVAPGLWLGLMYDRSNPPQLKMYFAIEEAR